MGILASIRQLMSGATNGGGMVVQPTSQPWTRNYFGDFDDYRANFADIRPIVEQAALVVPFAVDENGEKMNPAPTPVRLLLAPNDEMGFYDFSDYLFSSILSQSRVLVAVQFAENKKHLSSNIEGFYFLPPSSRQVVGGKVQYVFADDFAISKTLDASTVMEFYYSMATDYFGVGVSPAQASKKWATIADYIASYQAGFFQNGAKPEGMFVITASSMEQFKTARGELEKIHRRGSHGHFNYQFAYRPTDENGNPLKTASIEWVSFGGTNKDLSLSELITKTQEKMDSAYGVPAIARGNDATATYSNAEVSNMILAKRVDYLIRKTWAQFQRELARVCEDELPWTLSYNYKVPALADAERVQAETKQTSLNTLITAVNAGADVATAVKALDLPEKWAGMNIEKQDLTGFDLEVKKKSEHEHCHHEDPDELDEDPEYLKNHLGVDIGTNRRYKGDKLTPRQKLVNIVVKENKRILAEIRKNQNSLSKNDIGDPTQEEIDAFAEELDKVLDPIRVEVGLAEVKAISEALDLIIPDGFNDIIGSKNKRYLERLAAVAKDHDTSTAKAIRETLLKADTEGWTAKETSEALETFTSKKRADILARNELIASERYGSMDAAQALADANGVRVAKMWNCHADACPVCQELNGKVVSITENFVGKGGVVTADGKDYVFDWQPLDITQAHTNCRCYPTYKVIGGDGKVVGE